MTDNDFYTRSDIDRKFETLEQRIRYVENTVAVTQANFKNIIERLDKIDGHQSKLLWLMAAAILGGLLNLLVQAGIVGSG